MLTPLEKVQTIKLTVLQEERYFEEEDYNAKYDCYESDLDIREEIRLK